MAETMIEVQDLTKTYGANRALDGVSFAVPRGQVVGLLGPNGAGKTTAMRIITGFLAPTAGEARVAGRDVVEDPLECRQRLGYLPEGNPLYPELRLDEALLFTASLHGLRGTDRRAAVDRSIDVAGLGDLRRRLLGTMSKGQKQRVGLAQALMHDPDVLILDEPTSGLDPNQQEGMRDVIRALGTEHTVVLSTHILPEVEAVCDRALIISEGKLVADGPVDEINRREAGGARARLTVRGAETAVRAALGALPFVQDILLLEAADEAGVLDIRIRVGEDAVRPQMEAIAAAIHGAGLGLSALDVSMASLEQVFADLTLGAPAGDATEES